MLGEKRLCSRWLPDKFFTKEDVQVPDCLRIFSKIRLELKCVGSFMRRSVQPEGKASHVPHPFQVICPIKKVFLCPHLTFHQCPTHDSSSHQPVASQWRSRCRPAIIWTEERGGDGVSIELPWGLIHQMEKPMADWQHPSTLPPLPHSLHLFLIPITCSALYHSLLTICAFVLPLSLQLGPYLLHFWYNYT